MRANVHNSVINLSNPTDLYTGCDRLNGNKTSTVYYHPTDDQRFHLIAETITLRMREKLGLQKLNVSLGRTIEDIIVGHNSDNFMCVAVYFALRAIRNQIDVVETTDAQIEKTHELVAQAEKSLRIEPLLSFWQNLSDKLDLVGQIGIDDIDPSMHPKRKEYLVENLIRAELIEVRDGRIVRKHEGITSV